MVDRAVLAARIASVRDAVGRIRSVLPPDATAFQADRTTREVVIRIHEIASLRLDDLLQFCEQLAAKGQDS